MSYEAELHQQHVERQARLWGAPPQPIVRRLPVAPTDAPKDAPPPLAAAFPPPALPPDAPGWRRIVGEVSVKHQVTVDDIMGPSLARHVTRARHECCYRLRTETELSLPLIGRRMGGIDHTTVLYAIRAHAKRNGLPVPMGRAGTRRRWQKRDEAEMLMLKQEHSYREISALTGLSVGTVSGVVRRARLVREGRSGRMAKWVAGGEV